MTEQQFLQDLEKKLWASANTLRSNISAALYRDVVLGLVFLKYVSDTYLMGKHAERDTTDA